MVCILIAHFPQVWFDVMGPFVDEYNSSTAMKGTELAALQVAEQNTQAFVLHSL